MKKQLVWLVPFLASVVGLEPAIAQSKKGGKPFKVPGRVIGQPIVVKPVKPKASGSLLFKKKLNRGTKNLKGFVDLHTHPMAHLEMGGKLMHGAPDVDVLMPAGAIYNPRRTPAASNPSAR